MIENIIEIKNVTVNINGMMILEDVSFDVSRGDVVGIVGPNGGGKTTLLNTMLGIVKPSSGTVRLFGHSIDGFRDYNRIGYVAQHAIQFDPIFPATVEEIVSLGTISRKSLGKRISKENKQAVRNAMELVDIESIKDKKISDLSGGQKQRVFIAKALVRSPELLILDEATSGLDICIQDRFITLLRKLRKDRDITVLTVSHDLSGVMCQANRLVVINRTLQSMPITPTTDPTHLLRNAYGEHFTFVVHHDAKECETN
jgi:zinc transport system ATP-binding protein